MTLKPLHTLLIITLLVSLSTTPGRTAESPNPSTTAAVIETGNSDCETGLNLCDQALNDCDAALKAEHKVSESLTKIVADRDSRIVDLEGRDKIIYRQPIPWLIVGGIVAAINPLIGLPLVAAGIARAL